MTPTSGLRRIVSCRHSRSSIAMLTNSCVLKGAWQIRQEEKKKIMMMMIDEGDDDG